ncbi:MAG: FMN reductase [Nocardioides sp.]
MTRLVVVSAGLSVPSSTRLLADRLTSAAVAAIGGDVEVTVVELRPLAHALADATLTGFPSGELADAVEAVRRADALVAVTPVFSASYSGLFKMFVDTLEPGLLGGLPVLLGATAGTPRHSLVLDHAMRPLFSYLRAVVVPTGVFAASEDFGSTADGTLAARIERAAGELADLVSRSPARSVRDLGGELSDHVPFEELLRRA